jgi:hypothetical protein
MWAQQFRLLQRVPLVPFNSLQVLRQLLVLTAPSLSPLLALPLLTFPLPNLLVRAL